MLREKDAKRLLTLAAMALIGLAVSQLKSCGYIIPDNPTPAADAGPAE